MKDSQTIILHSLAPSKPDYGTPCNRCGVCCAAEPCPVAYLFLGQFRGRCRALQWHETENRYLCGMVENPSYFVTLIPTRLNPYFGRWFAKRISGGVGCDSNVTVDSD